MKTFAKTGFRVILGIIIILSATAIGQAQNEKEKLAVKDNWPVNKVSKIKTKEITGNVIYIKLDIASPLIGVAVDRENTDYYLFIDPAVKVVNQPDIHAILPGDEVRVNYNEIIGEDDAGKEQSKRVADTIVFIRRPSDSKALTSER